MPSHAVWCNCGAANLTPTLSDPAVQAAFAAFPDEVRSHLLALRKLIYDTAADIPAVGPLQETLRWGQPAYFSMRPKTGTAVRLGVPKSGGFALLVHCQTRLIEEFRAQAGDAFKFDGNRAILFQDAPDIQPDRLRHLIANALTYHLKTP